MVKTTTQFTEKQLEAILWAMLRLENEIDKMKEYKHKLDNSHNAEERIFFNRVLKTHKEHFKTFKEMVENHGK